jgi:hypothetical protein
VVRDVHFIVTSDKRAVSISLCVASRSTVPLSFVQATVGIFKDDGSLITDGTNTYHNIPPLNGANGQPPIILMFGVVPIIDPKYADHLLDHTVVQVAWAACKTAKSAQPPCDPDTTLTTSFLLPVTFDNPYPPRKGPKGR